MSKNITYVSEVDTFIANLVHNNPNLINKQKELRKTWWDLAFVDLEEQKEYAIATADKPAYAYFDYNN